MMESRKLLKVESFGRWQRLEVRVGLKTGGMDGECRSAGLPSSKETGIQS